MKYKILFAALILLILITTVGYSKAIPQQVPVYHDSFQEISFNIPRSYRVENKGDKVVGYASSTDIMSMVCWDKDKKRKEREGIEKEFNGIKGIYTDTQDEHSFQFTLGNYTYLISGTNAKDCLTVFESLEKTQ